MSYSKQIKEIESTVSELEYEFNKVLAKYLDDMYEQYRKLHDAGGAQTTRVYDKVCRILTSNANKGTKGFRTQYVHNDGTVLEW